MGGQPTRRDLRMSRSDNREGFIDFKGARIHFNSAGQGKALVFVHAAIADSRMWRAQVEYFSQRYRVITFDMRGFGQTAMVAGEYNTATDLGAVMDGLGIDQAVVIGCSMGGATAIDFTLHHPTRVLALVPVCAGISGFEVEVDAHTLTLLEQMDKVEKQRDFERFAELVVRYWIDGPRRKPEEVDPAVRTFVKEMLHTG
ncbi:alpha/beta hydrolase, partial [bacterium]|nr:alpha/beta hydrolase [bacterium]